MPRNFTYLAHILPLKNYSEIRETAGRVFTNNKRSAHQEIPPGMVQPDSLMGRRPIQEYFLEFLYHISFKSCK